MASFQDALASTTSECRSLDDKLRVVKTQLIAMENAMFDNISKGGVREYKVDTGQTVIEVKVASLATLTRQYKDLSAWYNEMCGLRSGSNIMVMRDASTTSR